MRTVGIDLAAAPTKTAIATIEWAPGAARVVDVTMPADDTAIARAVEGADRVGIDAPFGWPEHFADFLAAHRAGRLPASAGLGDIDNRRRLAYRRTDLRLMEIGAGRPLSVSADQIAHVAFRCAGLIADLGLVDRVDGFAVEAYPAAALRRWGLRSRGYKRVANVALLTALVDDLERVAPWLQLGEYREVVSAVDDAFDAVVTALIARAVALGLTTPPNADDHAIAMREGWIHVPEGTLADLV
ncbi:DUF429 domain-containing protein [Gordonia soli]|uniref:DUF429 domain-containing protein n=1 Tax=Gordonia soli NBRC 108243 TaxID=1223545 RepID=M0QHJ9_9ACTN|nr:DUF429 domain-containing protein [Gordonia soli]GAC66872.1 hypothetical protein GS4_05_00810 [Gordonia soli NBRC 108243]